VAIQADLGFHRLPPGVNKLGQLYFDAAGGNHNAVVFITAFHAYCHAIDDLIDGDVAFSPEAIENWFRLQPVIAQITSTYADSVAWEKADEEWKRQTADVLRLCGNDMIIQVAWIIGGYKHMRAISLKLREFAYHSQHS
jgi:hypothetical protein